MAETASADSSIATTNIRGGQYAQSLPKVSLHRGQRQRRTKEEEKPVLVGEWESIPPNPVDPWVGEAQGMLMGTDLVITGGFRDSVFDGTQRTTALDLSNPNAEWRELAPNPIFFITHAGHATKGNDLMYLCGGYLAAHPGGEMKDCVLFDKSDGDTGSWTAIEDLEEGRGGGALLYIKEQDSLLFTLGATRRPSRDENTTSILDLGDPTSKWTNIGGSPYKGNHVSAITARDCKGACRYFVLGGQIKEKEFNGNLDSLYEFVPETNTFEERAAMLEKKGHFTPAIVPYGCGFIIIGGAINQQGGASTDALDYYDIDEDKWYKDVGKYPEVRKTQVCAVYGDELTCSTGYTNAGYRVKLSFTATTTVLEASFDVNREGFTYYDGIFPRGAESSPTASDYAKGWRKKDGGTDGGPGLRVRLGGINGEEILGMSGGFTNSFTLTTAAIVKVEFNYKFQTKPRYDSGEYSEVLLSVDGVLYGIGDDDDIDYIAKNIGLDGRANDQYPIQWKKAAIYVGYMVAGTYDISLGGYNNKKAHKNSFTNIDFDNIKVTSTAK